MWEVDQWGSLQHKNLTLVPRIHKKRYMQLQSYL